MENISSTTSHTAELEGVFRLLQYIKQCGMESTKVEQWCNNLRAVHSPNEEIWYIKGMGKQEADILLAIHQLREIKLANVKDCKHVYAHKDTRKATKTTEAEKEKKGTTIEWEIEQMTTQASLETNYPSSDDGTAHLTESSSSEEEKLDNVRKTF